MQPNTTSATSRQLMLGHAKASEVVPSTIVTFLVAGFYMAHQAWGTGFFTADFTIPMAILFYASVFYVIVNSAAKILVTRKDNRILVEMVGAVLLVGLAVWVFAVFPFNFAHLADVVPGPLQFLLTWITNGIGRIIVDLVVLASVLALCVDAVRFAWARQQRLAPER